MAQPRELSIFIDESGVFGRVEKHSPFYILSLVFHDQSQSIIEQVDGLEDMLAIASYPRTTAIHTAPLVRREEEHAWQPIAERRYLFRLLSDFTRNIQIQHQTWAFDKRNLQTTDELIAEMSRTLGSFLHANADYFTQWDRIVVYYDSGQKELTKIVNTIFSAIYNNVEIRKVIVSNYRLFQVADLCCTLTLVEKKMASIGLSKSERDFFSTKKDSAERALKRGYIRLLAQMRFNGGSR